MTTQNRRNVFMPDSIWRIVEDEAKQEAERVAKERLNISAALAKIVLEWDKLKNSENQPEPA